MSKARELSKLLSGTLKVGALQAPAGTTAQRPSGQVGQIRYNSDLGKNEVYDADGWAAIASPPLITSVSPSTYNGESGTQFTISGYFFDSGVTVKFITNSGTEYSAATVSRTNASQLTATTPQDFTVAQEPLKVKVVNGSGLSYVLDAAIDCGGVPSWTTSAGNLTTVDKGASVSTTIAATDPDTNATISYSIASGSLPSGVSLNSSTGAITGTAPAVDADTTYNFTAAATDNAGNNSSRAFSIIIKDTITKTSLNMWLDPQDYTANASTWVSRTGSFTLSKANSNGKDSAYSIYATASPAPAYFYLANPTSMNVGTGEFSLDFWVYFDRTNYSSWKYICGKSGFWSAGGGDFGCYINANGTMLGFHTSASNGIEYAMSSIGTGWKHVALTRDSSGRKMYINGSLVVSDAAVHSVSCTATFTWGASHDNTSDNHYGDAGLKLGSCRHYTKALTSTEVSKNFTVERSRYGV